MIAPSATPAIRTVGLAKAFGSHQAVAGIDLEVPAGGRLLLSFDTANRDPNRFEDPERFIVDRADAHAHVTFGWGPHLCVGAGLARLELAEALRTLTGRFGPPTIVDEGPTTGPGAPDSMQVRFPLRAG